MEHTSVAIGAVVLAAASVATLRENGTISAPETRVFRAVNGASERWRPALWPVMQLGNGLMALAVPATVVAATRTKPDWDLAVRGAAAAFGGWQLAKGVKHIAHRGRPAAFLDNVQFRDGMPDGLGFVSGHTTVAAAVTAVLAPRLSARGRAAALAMTAAVGVARVYVGAHLPLDIVGGFGLGSAWGGILATDGPGARK